eukprot:scaffold50788_cov68-Phaeocystis_antarctica.AAC.6
MCHSTLRAPGARLLSWGCCACCTTLPCRKGSGAERAHCAHGCSTLCALPFVRNPHPQAVDGYDWCN